MQQPGTSRAIQIDAVTSCKCLRERRDMDGMNHPFCRDACPKDRLDISVNLDEFNNPLYRFADFPA